ncbi:nicotinate (nicotinamide) nucleotide adenylyltransferase [Calothrix sp. 336/3]|uniref:nicotinate (nicotinamide) nucleotide adenylyltransferase n=1 Tax=Calothrix sp. 336/3 TaxID=1337936 RepID=UPI0004E3B5DE|nr:nicotinate (nicotinamide) nucleotide adenylyltransferase [Calothrix sp. 336/3]AKG23900.1 nicotinate-nucleotide adenylyltransferase [Calothrix sp. 336/3]
MQQVAIFGGAFDPVHWGHLLIAVTALRQVPLERVLWVPSFQPPHKRVVAFEHRVAMVELAIANYSAFSVSTIEQRHHGVSYAINTLLDLSVEYPQCHWYWIVGLDTFQSLPHWYRAPEFVQSCHWLIAPRFPSGEVITQTEEICKQVEQQLVKSTKHLHSIQWQVLHTPMVGISSSKIREHCRDRQSIHHLVPESVREYIATHKLYGYE